MFWKGYLIFFVIELSLLECG